MKYLEWYKNATGKGLSSGKDNEVPFGGRNDRRNINIKYNLQDQHDLSSAL